jgi:hypothetical protein
MPRASEIISAQQRNCYRQREHETMKTPFEAFSTRKARINRRRARLLLMVLPLSPFPTNVVLPIPGGQQAEQ